MATSEGLNLTDLAHTSQEEIDGALTHVWSWRGPLYELGATSLMLDYAPEFAKLNRAASDLFGRPGRVNIILLGIQNLHSYMMYGWETGILNQFNLQRRNGLAKEQIMELVMFSQIYAGMRGLGHVFRAVGETLPAWGPPSEPLAEFPPGWSVDPDAFQCGLDMSTLDPTPQDAENLRDWYQQVIGYVPNSIQFGLKYHPKFVKINRIKWEVAIKTLPKQVAPWLLLRHHTITGSVDGLREAALLGRAWGITPELIVQGVVSSAYYFTGFEGLNAAHAALDDILSGA
jgi:hypothetical protein